MPAPSSSASGPVASPPRSSSAVAPLFDVLEAVELGGANLCVVEKNHAVRCVGDWPVPFGTNGVRNQGIRDPLAVSGLGNVRSLTVAQHRACAILDDGTVSCWGNTVPTSHGWTGAPEGKLEAVHVEGIRDVVGLALGWSGSCALTKEGRVMCWGPPFRPGFSKDPTVPPLRTLALDGITQISGDKLGACALRKDGTVHCFGDDTLADLATHKPGEEHAIAVRGLRDVVQISVGSSQRCALTKAGAVMCWGENDRGQLGDGSLDARAVAVPVAGLSDAIQIEASHSFACALTRDKKVRCWGDNGNCAVGDEHRACVKKTFRGTMGDTEMEFCPSPQTISLPIEPVRISLGSGTGCAIDATGHVACWGRSLTQAIGGCQAKSL